MSDGGYGVAGLALMAVFFVVLIWFARPNPSAVRQGFRDAAQGLVELFAFIFQLIGGLAVALLGLAMSLALLYGVIWLIKRMWEAA